LFSNLLQLLSANKFELAIMVAEASKSEPNGAASLVDMFFVKHQDVDYLKVLIDKEISGTGT
jgi:hypothetical protein